MTKKQILLSLKKIEKSRTDGYPQDALFKNYHLNIELLKFLLSKVDPGKSLENLKPKELLNLLITEVGNKASAKAVINKKNLKSLKPWLAKMDLYIKTLKVKEPSNTKSLLSESEKIFSLLHISVTKLLVVNK